MIDSDFLDYFYKINERNEISAFLKKFSLNNFIAEIGVNQGENFRYLLESNPKIIFGIDHWAYRRSKKHFDGMKELEASDHRVKLIRKNSIEAVNFFEDNFFDYIYIDANHHYEAVSQDIEQWYKKVKIGGVFAGHDYIKRRYSGVIRAIGEFKEKNSKLHFHLTKEECSTWLFIKE